MAPYDGSVTCDADHQWRSVCVFRCNEGFGMVNVSKRATECIDDYDLDAFGVWNDTAAECYGWLLLLLLLLLLLVLLLLLFFVGFFYKSNKIILKFSFL